MLNGWPKTQDPVDFLGQLRDKIDPSSVFFEGECAVITYSELFQYIDAFCELFAENGVQAGDRIAIVLEEDVHAILAYLAALWYGLELSVLDADATADESKKTLSLLDPDHLIFSPLIRHSWAFLNTKPFATKTQITLCPDWIGTCLDHPETLISALPAHRALDDAHLIVLTSGTTGSPKGVVLSFGAVLAQSLNMAAGIDFGQDSRILNLFRLSQIGSIVNGALLALLHGATFVRPFKEFTLAQSGGLLAKLDEQPVSHFIFVPSLLSCLFRDRAAFTKAFKNPEFQYFVTTAAPISDELWRQVEAETQKIVINTFGSSEVNNVTFTSRHAGDDRVGTIGHLLNAECRITDTAGKRVTDGDTGDLWVRSETSMSGYLGAPELTSQVLIDGWIKTGDLAHMSGDALVYDGRNVESIISGGHTIYPTEINNILLGHPEVADAFTFGKPHPEWGELVATCVVRVTPNLSVAQVSRFLRDRLSAHKLPRKIVFVDQIPLNERGKVRISEVQKLAT